MLVFRPWMLAVYVFAIGLTSGGEKYAKYRLAGENS
jgi:hypothetical protein